MGDATSNKAKSLGLLLAGSAAGAWAYAMLSESGSPAPSRAESGENFTREHVGRRPLRVMVSGAAGQIGYALLPRIASGAVFGPHVRLVLQLLDIAPAMEALNGVRMELEDGAYPLLAGVVCTASAEEALQGADVAVFVGGFPRKQGMLRKDLISMNCGIFSAQGKALEKVASRQVKVLVVANPANTNCLILKKNAPSIPPENFTCLTRLDLNRAVSQVAAKAGANVANVRNVAIWGNHSATQFPDALNATVTRDHVRMSARKAVADDAWLADGFVRTVQQRGKAIIDARKLSSAMSAANAIGDHLRSWLVTGTLPGDTVSMGVWSDGNPYGIREGLIFSFPVHIEHGEVSFAQDYRLDTASMERVRLSEAELVDELKDAEEALAKQASS